MSVLQMDPAKFSPAAKALYDEIAARRKAHGEGFGGPYLALLNHPELAKRIESDDLQARAAAEWGREALVEIVVVSGFYQMFAAINQGFGIGAAPTSKR